MTDAITCKIDGCDRTKIMARGMCNAHYKRWYRYGDPEAGQVRRGATPDETFAMRTKRVGDCLVWQAGKNLGYGRIMVDGRSHLAHRYAWERANGPIPDGMFIDHICHNRACVDVRHLRVVTQAQNNRNRRGPQSLSRTGYRNVGRGRHGGYRVQVCKEGKVYGHEHRTIEAAINEAARLRAELFGEFAGRG